MKYPEPIQEFFDYMQKMLDNTHDTPKEMFMCMSAEEAGNAFHMTTGMFIRNEFIHCQKGTLYEYVKELGFRHADDVSSFLMEIFHMYAHDIEVDVVAYAQRAVLYYDEFWANTYPDVEMPEL